MSEIELTLPTPHPAQQEILDNCSRFNHLRCGRRFGKTELITELCLPALEDSEPIGIWYPTYKDAADVWKKIKKVYGDVIRYKDETNKKIEFISGGKIDFWAMDNPESGQGFFYKRAIVDEACKSGKFKEAWEETIRPTLTDLKGDAWIMSRPKPNTYFKELEEEHKGKPNWAFFHYTTYDNPYIDPDEIQEAKNDLDPNTFDQEYMAEYVDPDARYFFYTFKESVHVDECSLESRESLRLSFDFNIDPFSCIVYQADEETMRVCDEIRLDDSDIYQMCDRIKAMYPMNRWFYVCTGDRTGYNQTGTVRGKTSYWKIIKEELNLHDAQLQLRRKNLDLVESRVLCNSALYHKDIAIDPKCKTLIKDVRFALVDERGVLIKDPKKSPNHFTDCFRYAIDANWPDPGP